MSPPLETGKSDQICKLIVFQCHLQLDIAHADVIFSGLHEIRVASLNIIHQHTLSFMRMSPGAGLPEVKGDGFFLNNSRKKIYHFLTLSHWDFCCSLPLIICKHVEKPLTFGVCTFCSPLHQLQSCDSLLGLSSPCALICVPPVSPHPSVSRLRGIPSAPLHRCHLPPSLRLCPPTLWQACSTCDSAKGYGTDLLWLDDLYALPTENP